MFDSFFSLSLSFKFEQIINWLEWTCASVTQTKTIHNLIILSVLKICALHFVAVFLFTFIFGVNLEKHFTRQSIYNWAILWDSSTSSSSSVVVVFFVLLLRNYVLIACSNIYKLSGFLCCVFGIWSCIRYECVCVCVYVGQSFSDAEHPKNWLDSRCCSIMDATNGFHLHAMHNTRFNSALFCVSLSSMSNVIGLVCLVKQIEKRTSRYIACN